MAMPQQWSELAHVQFLRMQKSSRTRPGHAATTFFAPLMAVALQSSAVVGTAGAAYPPHPFVSLLQHLNCAGPGQSPLDAVPAQSDSQAQRDVASPERHGFFEQHFTVAASQGHAPSVVVPPPAVQVAASTQTPGAPLGP